MRSLAAVLVLCGLLAHVRALGTEQSAAVRGKLLCNGKPYHNAKVKMFDEDTPDPDDLMAEGRSSADGTFYLHGSETEVTRLDVKLNVYHNCNDESVECDRKFEIRLPNDYVVDGKQSKKIFDAGVLNLNAVYPGESRDCLN